MRATFIRHGESTGNAGIPCHDLALLELTEKGWRQAREVAASWTAAPDLIVTSPYLRTQQTAKPTIERFPEVPVVVWPIQEFTYLEPSRWNGTLSVERKPHIEAYWKTANPEFCDGPGAESFSNLLRRAESAVSQLEAMPADACVLAFSHGQFLQAVRHVLRFAEWTDRQKMEHFWPFDKRSPVLNSQRIEAEFDPTGWRIG
jgi:broad specificity phosphatase PhoE